MKMRTLSENTQDSYAVPPPFMSPTTDPEKSNNVSMPTVDISDNSVAPTPSGVTSQFQKEFFPTVCDFISLQL